MISQKVENCLSEPTIAISQIHDNEIKIFDQARVWLKLMDKRGIFEIPHLSYYYRSISMEVNYVFCMGIFHFMYFIFQQMSLHPRRIR